MSALYPEFGILKDENLGRGINAHEKLTRLKITPIFTICVNFMER